LKDTPTNASKTPEPAVAPPQPAVPRPPLGADSSVVTLEDGEPCLENPTDGGRWDWDMEAVSSIVRCQECGGSERVFREPDGRIFCEICLLRGPAQSLPRHG
jgi:hypothetical protein